MTGDKAILAAKRQAHEALIAENPVEITIERTEMVDDGAGGQYEGKSILPPFIGRIVASSNNSRQTHNTQAGPVELHGATLYTSGNDEVRKSQGVTDRFIANGRHYEVVQVRPLSWKGSIYGYQASVIEVI